MSKIAIRTEKLTRDFGQIRAVDDLSLEIPAGIVFGFLGPNGSGKITTIEDGCVRVTHGPKENRRRPSVAVLFRSAAHAHGAKVVGVVLSGNLNDRTAGLLAIKKCGGVAVVQDPSEASYPAMPGSVVESARIDYCLPLSGIAPLLSTLASDAADEDRPPPSEMETEIEIATGETNAPVVVEKLGRPSDKIRLRSDSLLRDQSRLRPLL